MSDENEPRLHGYKLPGSDEITMLGCTGQFMSRATAEAALLSKFRTTPQGLREVELIALDDDGQPQSLGQVAIVPTVRSIGRSLLDGILGSRFTVTVPFGESK